MSGEGLGFVVTDFLLFLVWVRPGRLLGAMSVQG